MGPFETAEEEKDAKMAKSILPLRSRGNLLLCTILIGNVGVNSLISITTAGLAGGIIGFVISTITLLIIGEILP